jgi:hypothetical protein
MRWNGWRRENKSQRKYIDWYIELFREALALALIHSENTWKPKEKRIVALLRNNKTLTDQLLLLWYNGGPQTNVKGAWRHLLFWSVFNHGLHHSKSSYLTQYFWENKRVLLTSNRPSPIPQITSKCNVYCSFLIVYFTFVYCLFHLLWQCKHIFPCQ